MNVYKPLMIRKRQDVRHTGPATARIPARTWSYAFEKQKKILIPAAGKPLPASFAQRNWQRFLIGFSPGSSAMIRGFTIAVIALALLHQYDRYYNNGYFSDAVVSMLREIGHSFGF